MPRISPINLKHLCGKTYFIGLDPSYYADRDREPGSAKRAVDPWYLIIRGRRGHVYPHSDELLAVSTNYRGRMVRKLREAGCQLTQDGDDGVNATFPPELLPKVARIVGLYRRPRLTDAQRLARSQRMAAFRASQLESQN